MKVRRIVTENNKDNHSMVKWDSELEARPGRPGFERADIWATKYLPAKLSEEKKKDFFDNIKKYWTKGSGAIKIGQDLIDIIKGK